MLTYLIHFLIHFGSSVLLYPDSALVQTHSACYSVLQAPEVLQTNTHTYIYEAVRATREVLAC